MKPIVTGSVVYIGDGGDGPYRVVRMFYGSTPVSAELRRNALIPKQGPQDYWHFTKARRADVARRAGVSINSYPLYMLRRVETKR